MKGYLIFVEGGHTPVRVQTNKGAAENEGIRLAKLNPDKEVMVLLVQKRIKADTKGKIANLGSHMPPPEHLTTKDLIEGKTLKDGILRLPTAKKG